ncbi:MAG: lyase family protein, partial [Planctomycetota bacterium]
MNETSLWGGRFQAGLHPIFDELNRSLPFDQRLVFQDIRGSVAWAHALASAEVLTTEEAQELEVALREIEAELREDSSPLHSSRAEDVHSFIEGALVSKVGELGKRLHTGRSRNDQV